MRGNLESYKAEIKKLEKQGANMLLDLSLRVPGQVARLDKKNREIAKQVEGKFEQEYQRWYTEASAVIRQLLPDRMEEFIGLYQADNKRKSLNNVTYCIQDWMNGLRAVENYNGEKVFNDLAVVSMKFDTQLRIFGTVNSRIESSLLDIKQIVQADLFDTELEAARGLLRHGFGRGGGAVAGVVLEKHLSEIAGNHNARIRKRSPALSDYNDLLKKEDVIDVPTWRQIQRLADIRNLCVHNKKTEPTEDQINELIEGVEKITKTLF